MRKSRFLNSMTRKYIIGYLLVGGIGIFSVMMLICVLFAQSRQYSTEMQYLSLASGVENTLSDLNAAVNFSYLYLTETGIQQYPEKRREMDARIEEAGSMLKQDYEREMADALDTIRTYIGLSDPLIENLTYYLQGYSKLEDMEQEYQQLQKLYSFSMGHLQSVYSVRLTAMKEMEQEMRTIRRKMYFWSALLMILGLMISICYVYRYLRETTVSIGIMKRGVELVQQDVAKAEPIYIESNDELEDFAETFNKMLGIIQDQMKKLEETADIRERFSNMEIENLKMFSELQKSHLNFLQSRINPHFLFNTLNMISSMARMENADTCADMMEITASFLRYNLNNITKMVTLEKELENLRDYVSIQEYRYGGRYKYYFEIEDECLRFQMPCMIFQPLVENAIQHGIALMLNGGYVKCRVYRKDTQVVIEIEDNGVGMTEEQIQTLYQDFETHKSSDNHIGIRNIYSRLYLFYNGEMNFELIRLNPGLLIKITLPWRE